MSDATAKSASVREHRAQAERYGAISIAVITVSDTRTPDTDRSGQLIRRLSEAAGHQIMGYDLVKDEPDQILRSLEAFGASAAQAILTNGGTGISRRDQTCDLVAGLLEKTLPGYGELFRMLSFAEVGAAAQLSRAVAGIYRGKVVYCMPGSSNAVRLAMQKLILPELRHLVAELRR